MLDVPDNDKLLRLAALTHCFDRRPPQEKGTLEDLSTAVLTDADRYRNLQARVAEAQANGGINFARLAKHLHLSVDTVHDWVVGKNIPHNLRVLTFGQTKAVQKQAGSFREPNPSLAFLLGYATGKLESQDGFVRELDLHTNDPVIRDVYVGAIGAFFHERVRPKRFHHWDYVVDFESAEFSRHYEDASWDPVAKKQTLPWPNLETREEYFTFLKGYFHARWYIPRSGSPPKIFQVTTGRAQTAKDVVHVMHRLGMNPLFTNHSPTKYQIIIDDPADLTDLIDNHCLPPYACTIAEQSRARKCGFKTGEDLAPSETREKILAQRNIVEKYRLAKERVDEMHRRGVPTGTAVRMLAEELDMSVHTLNGWFVGRKSIPHPIVRKERLEALAHEQPDVSLMPYLYREIGADLEEARIIARYGTRAEFGLWNKVWLEPSQTPLDLLDDLLSLIKRDGDLSFLRKGLEGLSRSRISLELSSGSHEGEEAPWAIAKREHAYLRILLEHAEISPQRYTEYFALRREGLQERLDQERPITVQYNGFQIRVKRQVVYDYMIYYELEPDQLDEDLRCDSNGGQGEGFFFQELRGVLEHGDEKVTGMEGSERIGYNGAQLLIRRDNQKQFSLLRFGDQNMNRVDRHIVTPSN